MLKHGAAKSNKKYLAIRLLAATQIAAQLLSLPLMASPLSDRELARYSIAKQPIKVLSGKLITNNEVAFQEKLNAINSATSTLDLIYYIYSDDLSSSVLSEALIRAAQRGVQTRLLLDSHSNYKNADLFRYLTTKGVNVKFYNRPTENMVRAAVALTLPCTQAERDNKTCDNLRLAKTKEIMNQTPADKRLINTGYSGMFLSGIYAKAPGAMAAAILEGQKIDLAKMKEAGSSQKFTQADVEGLKKIAKLYWKSKTSDNFFDKLTANIQLFLFSLAYPEKAQAIEDEVGAYLPYKILFAGDKTGKDWSHLTDYTHHKFLLSNKSTFVMGGRNVENSYHLNELPNDGSVKQKYLFRDTDLKLVVDAQSGSNLEASFNRLWNNNDMSISMAEFDTVAPNDFVANITLISNACKEQFPNDEDKSQRKACVKEKMSGENSMLSKEQRAQLVAAKMAKNVQAYKELRAEKPIQETFVTFGQSKGKALVNVSNGEWPSFLLTQNDLKTGIFSYLENLPEKGIRMHEAIKEIPVLSDIPVVDLAPKGLAYFFSKIPLINKIPFPGKERGYGVKVNEELFYSKGIHNVWKEGLKNTCAEAAHYNKGKDPSEYYQYDVILQNAYFFPSSDMIMTLTKMLDGSWSCPGVKLLIHTNSVETTDLGIVNLFARRSLQAIIEHLTDTKGTLKNPPATVTVYEMKKDGDSSLHTKLSIMGRDLVVGSANLDVRSFMMDTNNVMAIRNAMDLNTSYRIWFNKKFIQKGNPLTKQLKALGDAEKREYVHDMISKSDDQALSAMAERWHAERFVEEDSIEKAKMRVIDLLKSCQEQTKTFLKSGGTDKKTMDAFNKAFKTI